MVNKPRLIVAVSLLLATLVISSSLVNAQTTTLDQRLQQYIQAQGIDTRNTGTAQTIKIHCSVAQAALKDLQTNLANVQTNRAGVYKNISDVLGGLQTRLSNQAFEITSYKAAVDTYNNKVAGYSSDMTNYQQALADSISVNCNQNPFGFKGALATARLYHDKLSPEVTDIRSYLVNTAEPSLDNIKAQLASGLTSGGQ